MHRAAALLSLLALFAACDGAAGRQTVVFDFTGSQASSPGEPLIDSDGTFYGASGGGANGVGTIWSLSPQGALNVLYDFKGGKKDGSGPASKPTKGPDGAFYGVTGTGGKHDRGTVFRLAHTGSGWKETVLYSFCEKAPFSCLDGAYPQGPLVVAANGAVFGTTQRGGNGAHGSDAGTLFRLDPPKGPGAWTYRVIHDFCSEPSCADGVGPVPNLLPDKDRLIGVAQATQIGGHNGVIYSVDHDGSDYRVLYTFDNNHGSWPLSGVARDSHGVLYGTTAHNGVRPDCGTVYSFDPSSAVFHQLYAFCANADDVSYPENLLAVVENSKSIALYGVAEGGKYNRSGLYKLRSPKTAGGEWTESIVYDFCPHPECLHGDPHGFGDLLLHNGALYGATAMGGATGGGVIYRFGLRSP